MAWIYLAVAIVSEVIGTLALKASNGFDDSIASTICVVAYGIAFYFLSLVIKTIPVGIAYAVWAGSGIVLITAFAALWFKQIPDIAAVIGIALIIAGVVVINVSWIQVISAIDHAANKSIDCPNNISFGVLPPRVSLGRLFSRSIACWICFSVTWVKSVSFGKYWRINPLVFSLIPRSQELYG